METLHHQWSQEIRMSEETSLDHYQTGPMCSLELQRRIMINILGIWNVFTYYKQAHVQLDKVTLVTEGGGGGDTSQLLLQLNHPEGRMLACNWWHHFVWILLGDLAKVTRVVPSFCHVPALWLHAYSTDLLHIWHKYNPWGGDVLCTISR